MFRELFGEVSLFCNGSSYFHNVIHTIFQTEVAGADSRGFAGNCQALDFDILAVSDLVAHDHRKDALVVGIIEIDLDVVDRVDHARKIVSSLCLTG